MEPDFSGWATKNDLLCSDGRTIRAGAFKHQDKSKVPLVWQHQHNTPEMVLGHAILEDRAFGVYAHGYFNSTDLGQKAKTLVKHRDVDSLSIYANNLRQKGMDVTHGNIKEVSIVLAGANPGAVIENLYIQHGDSLDELDDEAIIYTGLSLEHQEDQGDKEVATDSKEKTVQDVYDSFNEEQKTVVHYMIGQALESVEDDDDNDDAEHGDIDSSEFLMHVQEGIKEGISNMSRNVFEQNGEAVQTRPTLTHDQISTILKDGEKMGSLKDSFLAHAADYGIEDIDLLFPDAKALNNEPDLLKRQTEWVSKVLGGVTKSPFAKIKSLVADITAAEARAKGYVKGTEKTEEVIKMLRRTTSPTTIYKKQKLDRDDLLDITDFDVVAWLKGEIRLMLNEELARAILIGDGRSSVDDDKIRDPEGTTDGVGVRSIVNDNDMYAHKVTLAANVNAEATIEAITRARVYYRGTGNPSFYTTDAALTDMLLLKDKMGRRLYATEAELASILRVKEIVTVEVMDEEPEVLGVLVNLQDYTVGANKGGELTFFDDFDIDFNQHKYLMETRVSGGLTKPKSAIVILRQAGDPVVTPIQSPSFDSGTNTITIPTVTGVIYTINGEPETGNVIITEDTTVIAVAAEGYYIPANTTTEWTFSFTE